MRQDKSKAISLRKKGKSYNEIVKILNISKGTLSVWLRDIKMSPEIEKKFWDKTRKGWAESITRFNKQRAVLAKEKAKKAQLFASKDIKRLTKKELHLIGVALYWAEGNKRNRWSARFANSDTEMIRIIMRFFREICLVSEKKFTARVHLHPNIEENKTITHWSKITKIPKKQFSPSQTQISKSSKRKRDPHQLPYGTLHININDVNLVNKIKGWMIGLSK